MSLMSATGDAFQKFSGDSQTFISDSIRVTAFATQIGIDNQNPLQLRF